MSSLNLEGTNNNSTIHSASRNLETLPVNDNQTIEPDKKKSFTNKISFPVNDLFSSIMSNILLLLLLYGEEKKETPAIEKHPLR